MTVPAWLMAAPRSAALAGWIGLVAACSLAPAVAAAQEHPGTLQDPAQRTQRYYEQQQAPPPVKPVDPLQQEKAPDVRASPPAVHGGTFVLRKVVFTPSALLAQDELHAAVQPWLGRSVDKAGLDAMLDRVNALYRRQNITTARAVLPGQTIVDGVVHVELVEGRLGKLEVEETRHLRPAFIRNRIHQEQGEVVDSDQLRRDLVYINQTTDLQVRALLLPGAMRGQTDIRLAVEEPSRRSIGVFLDNAGVDSTGRERLGVQGRLYGLLGVDDRLEGNIAHSRGGNDGTVAYSAPLFRSNGRLGVSYAHSQINIIGDAFGKLDITGESSLVAINYRQPFVATLHWQFSGVGAWSITDSTTEIGGTRIADTTNHSATLGASLDHRAEGQRWNVTQLFTRIDSNEPMLGKSSFTIAPGSAFLIQRLGKSHWALRANAGWQWSSGTNLPSANLFQIGGPGSVRGYQRGVLAGPSGYYLDFELHRALMERWDLFVFIDHGEVRAAYPNKSRISGAGAGAIYRRGWFAASVDVAKPFKTVIPNQDSVWLDFRLSVYFD